MPRPKKIKEEVKPRKQEELVNEEVFEKVTEEDLQELEKKLRACTTETPRDIRYEFFCEETDLYLDYNNINVLASMTHDKKYRDYKITAKKPYLETAQKMLDVLKEWRGKW